MTAMERNLQWLRTEAIQRFGWGSKPVQDVEGVIAYWRVKGWPDESQTDHDIRCEITGYKNECIRDQGAQPWDHVKWKGTEDEDTWWHPKSIILPNTRSRKDWVYKEWKTHPQEVAA